MEMLQTKPTLRLTPPNALTESRWQAEDRLDRRRFALTPAATLLLIAAMQPETPERLCQLASEAAGCAELPLDRSVLMKTLDGLCRQGLLRTEESLGEDEAVQRFLTLHKQWERAGWGAAAEYHLASWDYRFLGGDPEGVTESRERMYGYAEDEPDQCRIKSYPDVLVSALPEPNADLAPAAVDQIWSETPAARVPITREAIERIAALTFGAVHTMQPPWPGAPVLLRTSPSGGARHPSEGYLLNIDVPDFTPGWHHIRSLPAGLELLREERLSQEELENLFPLAFGRAPFAVHALIMVTCVFERNMYRYREPRTFRTVHMDAGHLAGTIEVVAASLGLLSHVQYGGWEEAVEQKLGIQGMEEGFMLAVAIG